MSEFKCEFVRFWRNKRGERAALECGRPGDAWYADACKRYARYEWGVLHLCFKHYHEVKSWELNGE